MAEAAKPKSTARRDRLREVEVKMQEAWAAEGLFTADAPAEGTGEDQESYLATFPYPYMNGRIHLGHAFTITKAEYSARYQRLKGKRVLFPFAFHCTGMPIQAAANKLRRELEEFGCPPVFPVVEEVAAPAPEKEASLTKKKKGKKSKTKAKTGNVVRQWQILLQCNVPEEEIPSFTDPEHWLRYFPPHAQTDLSGFGLHVDWRRGFITTSTNPFYDSFVRWQFNTLRAGNKIAFGKRATIFSPLDGQACADHDRASGEGVGVTEYTLIKLAVQRPYPDSWAAFDGKPVFLVAATLRPETMYGQTNCFVLPTGDYGAFQMNGEEVFVCSRRSARNMAYQGLSPVSGEEQCLLEMKGQQLLGLALKAPLAQYDTVYTLPLLTISMGKGTGVVTSVPSDAPDDFAALRDLQQKPALRAKFGIQDEWVMPFSVVPILTIPGFGDAAAVKVCDDLGIKSQNDSALLKEAKDMVYLKGFYEGVLTVGPHAGVKVCDAKPLVRGDLIEANEAAVYQEPESLVMSRSGDECVVTYLDQWFLKYGEESWREKVREHLLNTFNGYTPAVQAQFETTLDWLGEWACSRNFGLGTQLPWDPQFVIESLSDSTIYMSYYTIAHLLQGGVVDGSQPGPAGIAAQQMTDAVWDFVFLGKPLEEQSEIPMETLENLRREFNFWYPVDLRVSGKDLIKNHLTMSLYNHAEIWKDDPSKWPRSFFTNGHVLVDNEKMSKSAGNFIILRDAIEGENGWGADATRFALADSGDTLDDANFETDVANMAVLRLFTEEEWMKATMAEIAEGDLRVGPPEEYNFFDRVFANEMNVCIQAADDGFKNMVFKSALKEGFHSLQGARDTYRDACLKAGDALSADGKGSTGIPMHAALLRRFMEAQMIVLSPICPHITDSVWREVLGNEGSVAAAAWPHTEAEDRDLSRLGSYVQDTLREFRLKMNAPVKKGKGKAKAAAAPSQPPTHGELYVAAELPEWNRVLLEQVAAQYDEALEGKFPPNFMKSFGGVVKGIPVLKARAKEVMKVAAFVKNDALQRGAIAFESTLPFNEFDLLTTLSQYLANSLGLDAITVVSSTIEDPRDSNQASRSVPGKPTLGLYRA